MPFNPNDSGIDDLMKAPGKRARKGAPDPFAAMLIKDGRPPLDVAHPTPAQFTLTPPPAMRERKGKPYVWVTWITALLAGEASCEWATWVRAHYDIEKRPRDGDLATWKATHARQVQMCVASLVADGWRCTVEDQNSFKVLGDRGILAGKPDIIAVHPTDPYGLVVDCKSGRRKDADFWQVLTYMLFVPQALRTYAGMVFRGVVDYPTGPRAVSPADLTKENIKQIHAICRRVMEATPPAKVPSVRECAWCDVRPEDCPEAMVDAGGGAAQTNAF